MGKKFDFDKKIKMLKAIQRNVPIVIGNTALKHFQQNFRDGGFTDVVFNPWVERKTKNKSDRRNKKKRGILVDSGALRNSGKISESNWNKIVVGFYGVLYGKFHNRGESPQPQRKFIGNSKKLNEKISLILRNELKKVFRS